MTKEEQILEYIKCKRDPIYFIKNYVKIPLVGGSSLFNMYPPQEELVNNLLTDHMIAAVKSRQVGISTVVQAFSCYCVNFYDNFVILIVSKSGPDSSDFCAKIKRMLSGLPDWLRTGYISKQTRYFTLENGSEVHAQSVSPADPESVGCSKAVSGLIIDECGSIIHANKAWAGLAPTVSKAQSEAKKKGIPYFSIIIGTPKGKVGRGKFFYDMITNAELKKSNFKLSKIHWKQIPELRDDPNWYKVQCKNLGNNPKLIAQELEMKFIDSDDSIFSEDMQIMLQDIDTKPINEMKFVEEGGILKVFKELDRTKRYLIGADVATETKDGDYSTLQILEYETLDQVAEYRYQLSFPNFASIIKKIARYVIPKNIIIIERNSGYGSAVIEYLINTNKEDDNFEYTIYGNYKNNGEFRYGLNTDNKNRNLMIDELYQYVKNNGKCIKSKELAYEILSLKDIRGKIQADHGCHDDLVFALCQILYVNRYDTEFIRGCEHFNDINSYDDDDESDSLNAKTEMLEYYKKLNRRPNTTHNNNIFNDTIENNILNNKLYISKELPLKGVYK